MTKQWRRGGSASAPPKGSAAGTWALLFDARLEGHVLGAMMVAPDILPEVVARMAPEDFGPAQRTVYERIVRLWRSVTDRQGRPCGQTDVDTVTDDLRRSGDVLEEIGGEEYLNRIVRECPNAYGWWTWAKKVRGYSLRRQICAAAGKALLVANDPESSGQAQALQELARLQSALLALQGDTPPGANGAGIPGTLVSEIERKAVQWAGTDRLAFGKLALVDGNSGLGKSLITIYVCACLTRGWPLWEERTAAPACNVILINPEDDPADTIRPRLEASGADLGRVRVLNTVEEWSWSAGRAVPRPFTIPRDMALLEAAIDADGARAVVLDPVMGCLDAGVKTGLDNEVRAALMPLVDLARRKGVLVILVRHLNKGGGEIALFRGNGSVAFSSLCRTTFLVAEHPDSGNKRVLAAVKSNIGKLAPSLVFSIVDEDGGQRLTWHPEECRYDANALLSARRSEQRKEIVRVLQEAAPKLLSPQQVALALGYGPHDDYTAVRMCLSRMLKAGEIASPSTGLYTIIAAPEPKDDHSPTVNPVTPVTEPDGVNGATQAASVTPVTPVTGLQEEEVRCVVCGSTDVDRFDAHGRAYCADHWTLPEAPPECEGLSV